MRLKKIPYAESFLKESEDVIILSKESETLKDIKNKVEIEIGCGKGDFIISHAQKNEDIEYYAIEKFGSVLVRAVEKQIENSIDNLHFILGDAEHLSLLFPPKSVDRIFLNFSDPWPKKRHVKRRLTYKTKLDLYKELLKDGSLLELKTDNQQLFEFSLLELSKNGWILEEVSTDLHNQTTYIEPANHLTEYEK